MRDLPRLSSNSSTHQSSSQLHVAYPDPSSSIGGRDNPNSSLNDSSTGTISADDDANSPLFQSDDFRIWCMKVIPCTKRFVHDWTICPFAHAGEKAVRRDPRLYTYTGIACPDMKKTGNCIRGDRCPYAHNVFEYWLHPTRYRTQLCNDGPLCKRGICFFAHSLDELRVPACKPYVSPEALARASLDAIHQNPHPLSEQLAGPLPQQAAQAAALAVLNGSRSITVDDNNGQQQQRQFQQSSSSTGNIPRLSKDYGEMPRWSDTSASWRVMASSPDDKRSFDYVGSMNLANMSNRPSFDNNSNSTNTHNGSLSGNGGSYMTNAFNNNNGQQQQGRQAGSPLESPGSSRFPSGACTPKEQYNDHNQHHLGNGHGGQAYYGEQQQQQQQSNGGGGNYNNQRGSYSDLRSSSSSPGLQQPSREVSTNSSNAGGSPSESDLAQSLATLKIALTQRQVASAAAGSNHEIVISTLHQILRDAVSSQNSSNNNTAMSGDDNKREL